jgi:hypothetical protein
MPKESSSTNSSSTNSPKVNESLALNHIGQSSRRKSTSSGDANHEELGDFNVRTTQPTAAGTASSGYVIFGGQVQIFNDDWKDRQPMSGNFEHKLFDVCWERGDCLLAFLLPCVYDCLLVTGMSKHI